MPRLQICDRMSIRQYVISDPANIIYKQSQNDINGTPSTVWQQQMEEAYTATQYIINSDHPHLYRRNSHTKDSETQFRPLQTVEDYNPHYYDPEYGRDPYWDDDIYDKQNLQFRNDDYPPTDDEDDPEIPDNALSRALIELWQPNFEAINDQPHAIETQAASGLLDETAFIHVLVNKEGEPAYIPLSTNLGLKYKKRMLYFPMDFGELTIDGLIDTGALSSAIPEADLRKIRLLAPQSIVKEGPAPTFQIMVANGQLETPKSTVELKFEVGDIEFHEIFIVMEKLTGPIIGLMFLQRNHTVLDMRQGILNFPYFSMQLKTADHKYSNVLEPILNPDDVTIPPNDRTLVEIKSQIYNENSVTGVLQPSDLLHEESDITFCAAIVTLTNGNVTVHINNFSDQPYKLKKGLHIANFSVLTPEQMKHVKPIDPVSTWHLLNENEEDAIYYVSSLLKANRNNDQYEQYWFPTPENPGDEDSHTPIQRRILQELRNLQEAEQLDPQNDEESRHKFLSNFDWKDSMLQQHEIKKIESLLVEYHDIFARHRFDIGMNEEFTVKLTPKDDSPAYSQSLPTPVNLKVVELALLHKYGIITTLPFSKYASPIFAQKKPNGKLRLLVDQRKINNLISDDYINNNHPVSTLTDAAQHMAGKKLFCKLDCSQAYHCLPMADQRSIEMLAFNFASRTFAYRRLAQGLSRALSAFSSFMREYLDKVIKADQCAQYVDDIGIAANDADHLIKNLKATFECIRHAGLKLTMHKCHFGATEIDFLGRTITPEGVKPQKQQITTFLEKTKFPKSKKALQRYLGFLNYYRNYIPRLSEKLAPFFQLLKKDEKVLVTTELVQQFNEINRDLDKCSQLALKQPLPNKQLVLMTDASFTAAGYAILTEDDPNQKFTSVKKSYAPIAYGSKTFTPSQLKMSIYAKEFLAIYYAFKEFGHIFWGTPKPTTILTDNKSVTRFFQTKIIPPALWNACDYVLQFNFIIAHIPGKNNTAADYLSRMEMDPKEKLVLKIREDVETRPIEVNVQSAGVSEEEQIFFTEDDGETEAQIWERKKQSRINPTDQEVVIQIDAITENIVDEITNFTQKLRRTNQILLEQSKDPTLQQLKAKIQNEDYSEEILQQDIRYKHYLSNLDRIVLKDEIVTRQYYDETGQIKHHQILLPKHLLKELLNALHGTAHKHPGISKMLQEIRQKYYYPGIAKHVKKWVEGCETCARDKRVPNNTITPELLNLPEWDLGPEDAMQIDLLPNLPTSGGYQTVMTAIDVFSRYLFAYPLVEATASNTAKVLIDIMTKHTYLPTTIITDKGTAFTSKIIAEITEILGITLRCATTKHPQTIGKLERTHASLKTNLKMASGEYRRQWHKYLPLAVLNYNTTYHSSIGCEPSKVFHGRIPYNVLDHKLGNNPNKDFLPTTEFAEELQQRTQILNDKTKQNIMQSYLKYKEYYDRKAKAAPLSEQDFCFILQPKADNQGSKIPFREYRWIGPYRIEKVLPNDNYIVRRLNTNKTQILHRIRLKKFVPNTPLEDKYSKEKLQPDEEIIIPQDDLYTISWEADFDYQVFGPRRDDNTNEELQIDNDASTTTRDYVIEQDADHNARRPGTATSRDSTITRDANDVTERNENEARPSTANSRDARTLNDDDDVNDNTANDKRNRENERPSTATSRDNQTYGDTPTELHNEIDDSAKRSPNRGEDDPVPGISDDERNEKIEGNSSPRGGKYNLRPNPTPNYTDEYRY